jgi:hypothetical protein
MMGTLEPKGTERESGGQPLAILCTLITFPVMFFISCHAFNRWDSAVLDSLREIAGAPWQSIMNSFWRVTLVAYVKATVFAVAFTFLQQKLLANQPRWMHMLYLAGILLMAAVAFLSEQLCFPWQW